jgi:hypothetical protein
MSNMFFPVFTTWEIFCNKDVLGDKNTNIDDVGSWDMEAENVSQL